MSESEKRDEIISCLDFIGISYEQNPALLASLTPPALPGWLERPGIIRQPLNQFFLNAESLIAPAHASSDSLLSIAGSLGPDATAEMLLKVDCERVQNVHDAIIRAMIVEALRNQSQPALLCQSGIDVCMHPA